MIEDRLKEFDEDKTNFQGKPARKYIISKETEHWKAKRKGISQENDHSNRRHIEFAKDLFISWDDDGSGILEPQEIIKPMIALGLSTDQNFAKKILQALDPNQTPDTIAYQKPEELKISLKDFIRIFKNDKVSENLVKIINQEALH